MPLTRRSFLLSSAAAAALPTTASAASGRPGNLVVFLARGGWDTAFCMDPKLHTGNVEGPEVDLDPTRPGDSEDVQTFGNLPVVVNDHKRPAVSAFFADWHHQTAVVNGLVIPAIAHHACMLRLLTGTTTNRRPDFATIAGSVLGADLPLGSVDFTGMAFRGQLGASSGTVGRTAQLRTLVDPTVAFPAPDDAGYTLPRYVPTDDERARVRAHLAARRADARETWASGNTAQLDALDESAARAVRLRDEAALHLETLQPGRTPTATEQLLIGVDLLAHGVSRSVLVDHQRQWDTHFDNRDQHALYDDYFANLALLLGTLDDRGLLDDTLVVACSEMSRTPKQNRDGGKEHWPHTSVLFCGGGVAGDRVYGGTDDTSTSLPVDPITGEVVPSGLPLTYENLAAGILAAMEVDPEPWLPGIQPYVGPLPS